MALNDRALSAPVSSVPAGTRWPGALRRFAQVPGGRTVLVGALAVAALIVLAASNAWGLRLAWQNGHWTVAGAAATVAAWQGTRAATGLHRRVRGLVTVAVATYLLGQVIWGAEVALGVATVPSLADLFFLASGIPTIVTLVISIRRRLSRTEEIAVYLDGAAAFFAIVAIIVVVQPGELMRADWHASGILAVLYPGIFLAAAVAGFLGVLAVGEELGLHGAFVLLAGVLLIGLGYTGFLWAAAHEASPAAVSQGGVASIGLLLVGHGAATWTDRRNLSPAYDRVASRLLGVLPLGAASISAVLLVLDGDGAGDLGNVVLHASIAATVVLLVIRQTLVLRDRGRIMDEARLAHRTQIEQMERLQGQLVSASKRTAVGELAAAVAHEVNNPLTGVLGYAELLLDGRPADDPERAELEIIRDEAIRARQIVRSLLDFARPHAPEHLETDLNALVGRTLDLLRYHLERGGVHIVERFEPLPPVALDQGAIQQALLNVLNNATQAIADDGSIEVSTARAGDVAIVTIRDDGMGMAQDVRLHAADPFFTTRSNEGATGLGLSVAIGLVEGHGGTLELDSAPGVGTVVRIALPFTAQIHVPTPTPTLATALPAPDPIGVL